MKGELRLIIEDLFAKRYSAEQILEKLLKMGYKKTTVVNKFKVLRREGVKIGALPIKYKKSERTQIIEQMSSENKSRNAILAKLHNLGYDNDSSQDKMDKMRAKGVPVPKLNPFGLPKSEAEPFEPYILPKGNDNILFLSDIHLPYHDIEALNAALEYGKGKGVNTIYLNGDILDIYKGSFHEQDPKKRDLEYELEMGRNFLDILKNNFPNAKIFYKEGNHEMRWERFLRIKAPIVLGIEEFRLPVLLRLREKGVTWIPNKQLVKAGKLNIIHGNEYKGGGGINVARTLWLRAGESTIAGDKHKTQNAIKTTIGKEVHGTWGVGALCELNPDYMPFNEWNHGFAHITVKPNGDFRVKNMMIINGEIF